MPTETVDLPIKRCDFPLFKLLPGWWYTYTSEKSEFVNGKDDIPYIMENNPNDPNHQPAIVSIPKHGSNLPIGCEERWPLSINQWGGPGCPLATSQPPARSYHKSIWTFPEIGLGYPHDYGNHHINWFVVYLPIWKILIRQIGSSSQLLGKIIHSCSKPPTSNHH